MPDLGAIHEDVRFDWLVASDLSAEMRSTASTLDLQVGERQSLRDGAREHWQGRYGDEFDWRVSVCASDAQRISGSLRDAADGLDELARLAREEQDRREAARAWEAQQQDDGGGGLGIPGVDQVVDAVGDGLDAAGDFLLGEDDLPPPPPPVEPPTIPIGDPGPGARQAPPASPVPVFGTGGVSSARPDDLDAWATASRDLDDAVRTRKGALDDLHTGFTSTLGWGAFDASSLLAALGTWVDANATDGDWVSGIAQAFRTAGAGTVPDAAIDASLDTLGLGSGTRTSVTYDDPILWGEVPTSGYADDPVNTGSGNFVETEVDLDWGGLRRLLRLSRTHNSRSDRVGPFGPGWSSWASVRLRTEPGGTRWVGPDGQEALIPRGASAGVDGSGDGRLAGFPGLIVAQADDADDGGEPGLTVEWFDGGRTAFDAEGRPAWTERGPGTRVRFGHDGDRLVEMVHVAGTSLRWEWAGDRVAAVRCSDGRTVTYGYDDRRRLVEVDGPRGRRRYDVDDRGRVAAVVDADGVVEVRNDYDGDGRVVAQASPFGRRSQYRYLPGRVTVVDDDAGGPVNSYVHDDHGRLVGVVDGHGYELRKSYDRWGNCTRIVERDGTVIHQRWDERGRLVRRQRPDGSWSRFDHDAAGRLVAITASTGAVTRYRYQGPERIPSEVVDAEGGVTHLDVEGGLVRRVVDPDGVEVAFGHDDHGELTAITDGAGYTTTFERDPAGRLTAVVSPAGRRTELAHDERGRLVERRDPGGATWRFTWSPAGRLLAVVDPAGGRRQLRHGRHGQVEQVVDESGHVTGHRYDSLGNLVGIVLPDGAKWELGYDRLCRLTRVGDPAGGVWLRDHDVVGHLVGATDPTGVRWSARFDPAGRLAGLDDGSTSVTVEHDDAGRVVASRRADGSETRLTYDRCGRVTSITGPDGATTRYQHTPAGRLAAVTDPTGRTTRYEHDPAGRRTATIEPDGSRWSSRHDPDGRLTEVVAPTGEATRFRYDAAGRLEARVAPDGGVTRYAYDPAGRVVAVTDPTGGVRRFAWSGRGQLREVVDANGGTTRYEWDDRGRLRRLIDPLGGVVEHTYDPLGRLVARRDQLGRTTTWEHDAAGRLARRTLPTGEVVRWWYDRSGRLRGIRPGDEADDMVVTVERDRLGRPVVITEPGLRHELDWDDRGRLVGRRSNGRGLRWSYDPAGRRLAIGCPDGTEVRYEHDPAGRLVAVTHPALGTARFERDGAGRLVAVATGGMAQRWTYAAGRLVGHVVERVGGRRVTELERDAAGRIVAVTTGDGTRRTFGYDPAGQLVSTEGPEGPQGFRYDRAGRLVAESGGPGGGSAEGSYEYDVAHQLLRRRAPCGTEVLYDYDQAGRRTRETGLDGTVRTYRWDWRGRLAAVSDTRLTVDAFGDLAEIDGRPLLWDPTGAIPQLRWIDGAAVVGDGRPLAVVGPGGPGGPDEGNGLVSWLDTDWQGSRVAAGGTTTDPWGADDHETGTGSGAGIALGYRGELTIGGLVWLRHRPYDPASRAFLATDPLPGIPGHPSSLNGYHYAGNDPVNAVDPLGLRPLTELDLARYREEAGQGFLDDARARAGDLASSALDLGQELAAATGDALAGLPSAGLGAGMVALGFGAAFNPMAPLARFLPEPLRPLVTLGSPLHSATGGLQAGLALLNGERNLDDLGRHMVNGPSTTFGQGLALLGGGDLSYSEDHGIWVSEDASGPTSGRGGTTYGSIFVTPTTQQEIEADDRGHPDGWDGLLRHEAVHSDQWARYGGGAGFAVLYQIEEHLASEGGRDNCFEQEAGLEAGGYGPGDPTPSCY